MRLELLESLHPSHLIVVGCSGNQDNIMSGGLKACRESKRLSPIVVAERSSHFGRRRAYGGISSRSGDAAKYYRNAGRYDSTILQ